MFEMNMGHQTIHIYFGEDVNEAANGNNDGENVNGSNDDENLNGNNDGEDANGNNNGEHVNGNNDGLNENYQDEEGELEVDSDFEYFLDGDTLSDGCDPLDEKEIVKKAKEQWERPPNYVEVRNFKQTIKDKFNINVSDNQLYRASPKQLGPYKLMAVVARDANNQMFPLAMALVESECKDSWGCVEELFPGVEHRYYVRHNYANFKLRFKEKQLRDIMWAAARAYVPDKFEEYIRQIFHEKRLWISKVKSRICPRIIEKLEDYKFKVPFFDSLEAGRGVWEVTELRKTYVVALNENSCSCNEWNLTGIPCVHATTAIVNGNNEPSEFVNDFYTVDSYKITYQHMIMLVPYDSLWVDSKSHPIGPPYNKKSTCHCGHTDHNVRACKLPGCLYLRKRKRVINQEQGAENLNSQEQAISSNTTFQNPSSITANQPPSRTFEIGSSVGAEIGAELGVELGAEVLNLDHIVALIPPNNMQKHPSPTKMWTTGSSTAHNSTLTSNVNPVRKGVGHEESRATSISSIGPVGRWEVLKIQLYLECNC
ncbi:hypothetical protein ACH5RR_029108 [Cinchona calisaya]|uniref:SWIM-type domain-containing protein n=1 Tax=Cinchona calisaya TaxID=153742 RepID=A0ABD2YTZ4_9GENT